MLLTKNKKVVWIYPDKITLNFLASLKERRKNLKLTIREISKNIGITSSCLFYYEQGRIYPCLKNLIKLADFYSADISESINWKVYHGKIKLYDILKQKIKYALSYGEIASECEISKHTLLRALNGKTDGSIRGLGQLIEVLEREKEREKFRNELLQSR